MLASGLLGSGISFNPGSETEGMTLLKRLLRDLRGASAAEYALILAVIGSALALASFLLGETIAGAMNATSTCISSRVCG